MTKFNDIVTWIISSGFLGTLIVITYNLLNPLIKVKIDREKNAKVKTAYEVADNIIKSLVVGIASTGSLTGPEKKAVVTKTAKDALDKHGIKISDSVLDSMIDKFYELDVVPLGDQNKLADKTDLPVSVNESNPEATATELDKPTESAVDVITAEPETKDEAAVK